ncbi:MAG: hypothetical protein JWN13_6078 [Betaproteobacteria bacterium]|jgi:hypothetical protein|nr:hypothetical protein [Betaproteobacteria bacterium]
MANLAEFDRYMTHLCEGLAIRRAIRACLNIAVG